MEKYKYKYRITSTRLQHWNYNSEAAYFITVCTYNKEHYFGEIINSKMQMTQVGTVAKKEWLQTPSVRPDMNIILDEFIIMPNHFHGIIIIGENKFNNDCCCLGRDAIHGVSTKADDNSLIHNVYGPQRKNLSSLIRGFKSSVTTYARKNNLEFNWQERFHDHIIRTDEEYIRIKNYIMQNVMNWKDDGYH